MRKRTVKFIAVFAAFCVAFSGLPFMAGNLDAHAAAKKLPKKITLKATASGQTAASLSWNKIKSPQKGYAVFRNGIPIKHLNTKKIKFSDTGLKAGTTYQYQIKTYKTKKVTQWYNKQTKKWQTKKPAAKYRGKSKKVTAYTYKTKSNLVTIKTAAAPTYTITWKNWDGSVLGTVKVKQGTKPSYSGTPTRAADANATYSFSGWSPKVAAATANVTYTAQYTSKSKGSQYSYEIKFINEPYGNGGTTAIYIKTDNPSPFSFDVNVTDKNGSKVQSTVKFSKYSDVTLGQQGNANTAIKGGYISILELNKAGELTFTIYEEKEVNGEYSNVKVASRTANVHDYAAEEKAWMQSVVDEVTTSSMTGKEKMNAICGKILSDFTYLKKYNGRAVELLADTGIPYWKLKHIDSAGSPSLLDMFGDMIGYPVENCYAMYERGTSEWYAYHSKVYSKADDTYFDACPPSDSNVLSSITPFDPNTYEFWGE